MVANHIILAAAWLIYCVLHSVLASGSVKRAFEKDFPRRFKYYRLGYTLFAFVTLIMILVFQFKMKTWKLFETMSWTTALGIIIGVAGLLLMIVCIKRYFFTLSGLKTLVTEETSSQLIISGVHRYIRHPLYLGTFAFIWGLLLVTPTASWLISSIIITVYTVIAIAYEEAKLVKEFGEQYKKYQQDVPMLFPRMDSPVKKQL